MKKDRYRLEQRLCLLNQIDQIHKQYCAILNRTLSNNCILRLILYYLNLPTKYFSSNVLLNRR